MSGRNRTVKFAPEPIARPWQDSLTSSSKALSYLLATGTLSDITFAVGPQGTRFKVHRLILATRSPVFDQLLVSDPRYGSCDDVVPIRDCTSESFHWLMNHIYSDKNDLDDIETALQAFHLSEKYMVASAYQCCIKYFQNNIQKSNVLRVYGSLTAQNCNNEQLFKVCRKIFMENADSVLMSENLKKLSPQSLSFLLQESLRVSSEVTVFRALLMWGKFQLSSKSQMCINKNIRREIEPFLTDIRFLAMTSDEFVQSVVVADILDSDEIVSLLKHIATPALNTANNGSISKKLCPIRQPRPQLILSEVTTTVLFDDVHKSWITQDSFKFELCVTDIILLQGLSFQIAEGLKILVEIFLGSDVSAPVIATAESHESYAHFKTPVPIQANAKYSVRVKPANLATKVTLYGCNKPTVLESSVTYLGVTLTISPGVFIYGATFA